MTKKTSNDDTTSWLKGELRLAGIDSRMISLLKAIAASGSINQAAKQVDLSYKGAWQMIERANNLAPKVLVATATGGSKGGGTSLTSAGLALLNLFTSLEEQHQQFLNHINQNLADNPDLLMLLKRLDVKTSADNQLFGKISAIHPGGVNAEIFVALKGGEQIVASFNLAVMQRLNLNVGADTVILINSPEIVLTTDLDGYLVSARNKLVGSVMRIQSDTVNAEVILRLNNGETLVATVTQQSAKKMRLEPGVQACALFKSNSVMLGVMNSESKS